MAKNILSIFLSLIKLIIGYFIMKNCFSKFCKFSTIAAGGLFAFSQIIEANSYNKLCAAEKEDIEKNVFSNPTPTSSDKVENYLKKSKKIL